MNVDHIPKVTVVIPFYKAYDTLPRTLKSLEEQTFRDFVCIIVADLDDKGLGKFGVNYHAAAELDAVIRNYNIQYKLVVNYGKSNPATARNVGIQLCKSKYIAFCDADDWWHPSKLEKQVRLIEHTDSDMVYSLCEWVYPDGKRETHGTDQVSARWSCYAPHSTILVRRDICPLFNEKLKAADDYAWLLEFDDLNLKSVMIPEVLAYMGISDSNLTSGNTIKFPVQTAKVHFSRGEYLFGFIKFLFYLPLASSSTRKVAHKLVHNPNLVRIKNLLIKERMVP